MLQSIEWDGERLLKQYTPSGENSFKHETYFKVVSYKLIDAHLKGCVLRWEVQKLIISYANIKIKFTENSVQNHFIDPLVIFLALFSLSCWYTERVHIVIKPG